MDTSQESVSCPVPQLRPKLVRLGLLTSEATVRPHEGTKCVSQGSPEKEKWQDVSERDRGPEREKERNRDKGRETDTEREGERQR